MSEKLGRYVMAEGVRTHVVDVGEGEPIVLIHGASFGTDAQSTWFYQIEHLQKTFRVIAPDQIGFGYTGLADDRRYRNRLERCPNVVAVLRNLGVKRATLVGHSEGAFVATWIALNMPDLVSRLILLTTGGTAPPFGDERDEGWMEASRNLYDCSGRPPTEDEYLAAMKRLLRRWNDRIDREFRRSYRLAIGMNQFEMFAQASKEEIDYKLYTRLQAEHIHPHLHRLAVPTLLLWSGDDPTVPVERGLKLMRMMPGTDMHILSGAAHALMLDRPEAVNSIISSWRP